ncbi:MAG TPA: DUF2723 domain-containing protein, partial [Planctomycetota bacterium]|nr:DUF2723 domain-containing protein [Planctomycetota bacterium]
MRRFWVPAIPFLLSLGLSSFTVGTHVGWQDSGFYLAGIRDLGVLYPPGFALYLVLAKAWTLLLGFLDFTLAVHLFSSVSAAAAAWTLAVAARDLLRTRGTLSPGGPTCDGAAVAAGCLAASGFSFWSAALMAKGYAFYYFLLTLLIWRMIRADESGRPRDFTMVAVLIGLSWAAHPSAVGIGPALVLFVLGNRRTLGGRGIAARIGIAAGCAVGPSLLLPIFAARDPEVMFGNPASFGEWLAYLAGSRFTGHAGVFGADGFRFANAARYLWEDFLGIGLLLAVAGLVRIAAVNRRLLLGLSAWVLPSALLATLFRIEGQQDFWLVGAWLPLHLAVAVGLAWVSQGRIRRGMAVAAGVGLFWAVAVNVRSVSMRNYTLAEDYGRFHLDNVERDAILILESDDALATTQYLQEVKGLRPDVVLASASRFGSAWYAPHLRRRHPRLNGGDTLKAFVEANAANPIYFEAVPPEISGSGVELVPAGPLLKMAPANSPDPAPWVFPVRLEDVRARFGRERGIRLELLPEDLIVTPEPYEQRWVSAYVRAQAQLGQLCFRKGGDG